MSLPAWVWVCVVSVCVRACKPRACPRHNSKPLQARTARGQRYKTSWLRFLLFNPQTASEAQVPIQNYRYASIFIISAHCFRYSSKILF